MNIKLTLILCCLTVSALTFGQQNQKSKLTYAIGMGAGNSTLTNNQIGVLNSSVFSLRFNIFYSIAGTEKTKLGSGIIFSDCAANFFNGNHQSKIQNQYLQLPVNIIQKIAFDKDEKLGLMVGIGIYANFLVRSTIIALSQKNNTKSGGINFGYTMCLGMEYKLSSNTSIGVYADAMNEMRAIKKNGYEQKQNEIAIFSAGFTTSL